MLLFSQAASLLPAACSKSATAAAAAAGNAAFRLLSSSTPASSSSSSDGPVRGRTAGELGDDAAQSMQGAEGRAAGTGDKVEPKVSQGFVPSGDATPSPDSAGRAGGIGSDIMGDMMDMMHAASKGDKTRAAADIADMARHQSSDANTSSGSKIPHTTTQDWPRGSITDPNNGSPGSSSSGPDPQHVGGTPFVNTDESSPAGIDRYEGTIPRVDPSEELPEVDQDPPESVTAGPTPGYSPRGGDQRPI